MKSSNRTAAALIAALVIVVAIAFFAGARGDAARGGSAQLQADVGESDIPSLTAHVFRRIAENASPVVVNIRTESRRQTRDLTQFFGGEDPLGRFFGRPQAPPEPRDEITEGAGTGFIIDSNGLILTNNHVVAGATKITVGLYADEEEEYAARVVGRDPLTDSALIELTEKPPRPLPSATLGDSRHALPGDWVMAIGNPFNLAHTVTVGVISATGRPFPVSEGYWQDVLQTDAAINPGNSGGPLLNLRGEVVGITTAILASGPVGGNVGVGFAIPIDVVRELLPQLRQGTVTRGRIGVQITPVTRALAEPLGLKDAGGALVRTVDRDGPAAEAGIRPGDVIVGFAGRPVEESDDLVKMVAGTKPGTTVPVEIVRNGAQQTIRVGVEPLEIEDVAPQAQGTTGETSDTGWGMTLSDIPPEIAARLSLPAAADGALVAHIEPGSAADRAGLQPGDVVLEVNRKNVSSASEAAAALRGTTGDTAFVLVWRRGQEVFITLTRE